LAPASVRRIARGRSVDLALARSDAEDAGTALAAVCRDPRASAERLVLAAVAAQAAAERLFDAIAHRPAHQQRALRGPSHSLRRAGGVGKKAGG
jgi:hypothetical protein